MEHYESLLRLILPESLFQHFEIVNIRTEDRRLDIFLDEKQIIPDGFTREEVQSKGFSPSSSIQDFPIRDKSTHLHLRRRKWQVLLDNRIIHRDLKISTKGTRMTEEFASFLKGTLG